MNRFCLAALSALLLIGPSSAADQSIQLTVAAGKYDRVNDPVSVPLALSPEQAKLQPVLEDVNGKSIPAQLTETSLLGVEAKPAAANSLFRELHFILPSLKAGTTAKLSLRFSGTARPQEAFHWKEVDDKFSDLSFGNRPVLRYVHYKFDDSTPANRSRSFKVFHHLYDPSGKLIVTNDGVVGLYPHHRGIFFGFNRITYGNGKKADVWHGIKSAPGKGNEDAHQTHEKTLATEAGPVLGRHRVQIAWHGEKKEVFALEERELTVYNVPGGQLVEFASIVRTTDGPVKLDGDPQHAGFHFRADKEVAEKSKDQTVFIRPDGVGNPGQKGTRNWDPKTKKGPVNLPWNAMSFLLGGKRYTVAYLDKPSNPKEARFSEREYGRIGSYFEYNLTEKNPLRVDYRLWLQEGQMKPEQVADESTAFVAPVAVTVK